MLPILTEKSAGIFTTGGGFEILSDLCEKLCAFAAKNANKKCEILR